MVSSHNENDDDSNSENESYYNEQNESGQSVADSKAKKNKFE